MLFNYCNERNCLNKNYLYKVAENWFKNDVVTMEDLEEYLAKFSKMKQVQQKVCKALKIKGEMNKYQEAYVEKWMNEYGYDFDMIEEALKKTVNTNNASINYINGILTNWYKDGIRTTKDLPKEKQEDTTYDEKKEKEVAKTVQVASNSKVAFKAYEQRAYKDMDAFYDNL